MKKIIALILVLSLVCITPVLAEDAVTPVELNAEAAVFNVTVPTALPITVDANGNVTTASDVKIINNSYGMVIVDDVKIVGANSWQLTNWTTEMKKLKVNTKEFAFIINNDSTGEDGNFNISPSNWHSLEGKNDTDSDELVITYNAKLPAQSSAITNTTIANVTFVINWDEVTER